MHREISAVSVGMISEGTDIPRLQVCCHLSAVKTELYFRQVLGRILRVNTVQNQEAWMYTFAEENLVRFAERIEQDVPDSCSVVGGALVYTKEEFHGGGNGEREEHGNSQYGQNQAKVLWDSVTEGTYGSEQHTRRFSRQLSLLA